MNKKQYIQKLKLRQNKILKILGDYQINYIDNYFNDDDSTDIESMVAFMENTYNDFDESNDHKLFNELKKNKLHYHIAIQWFNHTMQYDDELDNLRNIIIKNTVKPIKR